MATQSNMLLTEQPLDLGLEAPKIRLNRAFSAKTANPSMGDAVGPLNYVFTTELGLAANAAYVTKRPLLLRGAPGSGKSSFARAIAESQGWSLLVRVINSDSKLDDLLWRYDYVRRLQDASNPKQTTLQDNGYVEPQALWWALARIEATTVANGHAQEIYAASLEMEGGTVFHFVTEGIEAALERARDAAGTRDIRLGGGASTVRQYLQAKLVDEMHLAVSPVLLGAGEPLLAGLDLPKLGYRCEKSVTGGRAVHYTIVRA